MATYGFDESKNKKEVYTKEEVITILQQAIESGSTAEIDPSLAPIPEAVKEKHAMTNVSFWVGSESEFEELGADVGYFIGRVDQNKNVYIITDDHALDSIEKELKAAARRDSEWEKYYKPKVNCEYTIGDEVNYDEAGTGLINHNNGTIELNTAYHKKKAVSVGEAYEVKGKTFNKNNQYSAITYLDADGNVIGYYPENKIEGEQTLSKYIVNISNPNIAYIVINGANADKTVIRTAEPLSLDESIKKRETYLTETPAIKGENELAIAENGLLNFKTGNIENATSDKYKHAVISVENGETYHISGISFNYGRSYRAITLLDANGDVLKTYPTEDTESSTTQFNDFKYTIKEKNAVSLVVNGTNDLLSIKKATQVSVEEYVSKVDPNFLLNFINMADMVKRVRAGGKTFVWDSFDDGYITIVFDDGRSDLSTVASIFEEYNIPFCAAIPPAALKATTADNRTIKQVCQDIITNGGEILAHDFNPLTSATDYENIKRITMSAKEQLVKEGFNIRGLMKPGGAGNISWKNNNLQRFTQLFYDYADVCGDDAQYYKPRITLGDKTIAVAKGYIDDAIANNEWYIFAAHTLDGTEGQLTESYLREFIEYAIEKGIKFKTYAYMYDNFGKWE